MRTTGMRVTTALFFSLSGSFLSTGPAAAACAPDDAVAVHVNQLGYFNSGSKLAIVAHPSPVPVDWVLQGNDSSEKLRGKTTVYGTDPVSGDNVHRADFSDHVASGNGFRVVADCVASEPFSIGPDPYGQLQYDALAYFYHNRSGVPVIDEFAGGEIWARPAAHVPDTATCRRDKDPLGNRWPGCDYTLDVTGGWYDAGDHGKYVVNGGISAWTLMNLYETQQAFGLDDSFRDGLVTIPEAGNGTNDLLDEARFELEFLLRMQAPQGAIAEVPVGIKKNTAGIVFSKIDASGMAHHKVADENWTALPMRPEDDPETRVLYPVSTAATLNLAATAAQCARVFSGDNAGFAGKCRTAAERAYAAAKRNPQIYFVASFSGSGMYGDSELDDEFFWAAAELFVTTGEAAYLDDLRRSRWWRSAIDAEPGWPHVAPLGMLTLAIVPSVLPDKDRGVIRDKLESAARQFEQERDASGYRIPYATDRYNWGSNSNLLNRAIILLAAHQFNDSRRYRDAAVDVMDYLLGRNPLDQSYISGYGERPMQYPHHRFWAPGFDAGLPPPPPGALSGGPNSTAPADDVARQMAGKCAPQRCWADKVEAYALNEVAINWNAPLVWVAAVLAATAEIQAEP